jgi:glycosyltransferase involved in cell wall biosynthesis
VKIILAHNSYRQQGGEDIVFHQECQLLERAGHEVVMYRRSNWAAESDSVIKRLALPWRTVWAEDTRREFAELLRAEKPDLVHVHNTFFMISPSIYAACREAGVPVVQTLHNYRLLCPAANLFRNGSICEECMEQTLWRSVRHGCYRSSRPATAAVALMLAVHRARHTWTREVTRFIALTEFARSKFVQGGLPGEKIFVKPNFLYPDPGLRNGGSDGDYALFLGRLSPEKQVSRLLKAWTLLRNRIPLVIVGEGPERRELEMQSLRDNLSGVHFRGQLPHDRALAIMRGARLLVFPSECYESFGMAIIEALASGVPVICCRLGSMREIIADGRTGLHSEPGNAEDLAEKVDWAWNNPVRLRVMVKEARQVYEERYTAEKNYTLLMEIYRSALAANAAQNHACLIRMSTQVPGTGGAPEYRRES